VSAGSVKTTPAPNTVSFTKGLGVPVNRDLWSITYLDFLHQFYRIQAAMAKAGLSSAV